MKLLYRIVFLLTVVGLLSFTTDEKTVTPFFQGITQKIFEKKLDDLNEVYLETDSIHNALYYSSNVFTPVCTDNVCKPVRITLFWDVCGTFLGFKVPNTEPLTKKGHKPFSKFDYYTLYLILNNPRAEVGTLTKTNLVQVHNTDMDGFTGATSAGVSSMVVDGAAYSTYTLWHMVNDFKQADLKSETLKNTDYYLQQFSNTLRLTTPDLTRLLYQANLNKVLRKYAVQKILMSQLGDLTELNILLINNYLSRQPNLSPEIEKQLSKCQKLQQTFERMLPQ